MSQQLFSNFSPSILQVVLPQKVASANNVVMATLGERFKRLRLRKGFGQSGLAAAIGLKSAQTISNFEIGKSEKMYLDNWRRVAEVFKVSVDELNEAVFSESSLDLVADDDHELLRDGETRLLVPMDPTGKDFVARYKASGMTLKDFNEKLGGTNYPQTKPQPSDSPAPFDPRALTPEQRLQLFRDLLPMVEADDKSMDEEIKRLRGVIKKMDAHAIEPIELSQKAKINTPTLDVVKRDASKRKPG